MSAETRIEANGNGTTKTTALERIPAPANDGAIAVFSSAGAFEAAQRMAKALSSSTLVPKDFRGPEGMPNCLIALELASRIGASAFMVMQSMYVVHGKPGWSSQFLIGTVNTSGKFTPLRFRFEGKPGSDDWGCRAIAKDKATGEECVGALITIKMAKAEGWATKQGSKWLTMPEQMLMYRAASFWTRVYAPEVSLGIMTTEEASDVYGDSAAAAGNAVKVQAILAEATPKVEPKAEPAAKAEAEPKPAPITPEQREQIVGLFRNLKCDPSVIAAFLKPYGVKTVERLNGDQAEELAMTLQTELDASGDYDGKGDAFEG